MANRKPDGCVGCPLYGDGLGWVPDTLKDDAPVLLIRLFPGQYETTTGVSRSGGQQHAQKFEKYAGAVHMSYSHVIRCRGQRGVKLPTGSRLRAGANYCRQYDRTPKNTALVVMEGIDVARLLTPELEQPERWRGFLLPRSESSIP